jgi:pimeloyl-ACP methyl ester carboxylesterase
LTIANYQLTIALGMSLYVHETGTPGAPGIVFLHGVGTSGWMWWMQTAALNDFHCLNVDLPGHGRSNQVAWVSLADTADHIAAIIQARAFDKRAPVIGQAHIVGLSLGGYVALALLERHAGVAGRVVISGVTAAPWPNRALLKPQLWLMSALMKRRWYASMQAKAVRLPPQMQAAFTENLQAMDMAAYRRIMEEAAVFRPSPLLHQVNTPTLVTAGGNESKIITQAVTAIQDLMPNAQGRIAPGLGHGWNVEAPDLFNSMVRAWISNAPLPKTLKIVN